MAEDTKKDVAATVTDDGSTAVTDAALDQAAADAVATQTDTDNQQDLSTDLGVQDTSVQAEVSELDAEGLPVDHAKRSDLGRKVTAFHRRQDEFESRIDRLLDLAERQAQTNPAKIEETIIDPDEPITYAEMNRMLDKREKAVTQQAEDYNSKYLSSINKIVSNISEQEQEAIFEEMKNITYDPSNNPVKDAETNLLKAERAYLRKKLANPKNEKVNPLEGKEPRSALGTTTTQQTAVRDVTLPKLDAAAQSYLAYVAREDGQDQATNLHRGLAKKE